MIKYHKLISCSTVVLAMLLFAFKPGDPHSKKKMYADISDVKSFQPNREWGWDIYSSYLNQDTRDTVEFELILKQYKKIKWKDKQFIGTITDAAFIPKTNQRLTYKLLLDNFWEMTVDNKGKVYFNLSKGYDPPGDSVTVIPVKVRYKNN